MKLIVENEIVDNHYHDESPNFEATAGFVAEMYGDDAKWEVVDSEEEILKKELDEQTVKVNRRQAALANLAMKARSFGLQKKHSDLFSQNAMQKIVTVWIQGGDGEFAISEMKKVTGGTKAVLDFEIRDGVTIRDKLAQVFMSVG